MPVLHIERAGGNLVLAPAHLIRIARESCAHGVWSSAFALAFCEGVCSTPGNATSAWEESSWEACAPFPVGRSLNSNIGSAYRSMWAGCLRALPITTVIDEDAMIDLQEGRTSSVDGEEIQTLEVHTPAKLNLHLELLGKRPDGFHELESLMVPIGLYDTLRFRKKLTDHTYFRQTHNEEKPSQTLQFTCRNTCPWHPDVPTDASNLVVRAIQLLEIRCGRPLPLTVGLTKRIPSQAGLGGGSSDAAATLKAVDRLYQLNIPAEELSELAAELGSDVPFFLMEGTARATGRGEHLERLEGLMCLNIVVVKPPGGLSTPDVFRHSQLPDVPQGMDELVQCLRRGDFTGAGRQLHNRLQPAAMKLSHVISDLKKRFDRLGLSCHMMSGSGTAYFCLCPDLLRARGIASCLRNEGWREVYVVQTGP